MDGFLTNLAEPQPYLLAPEYVTPNGPINRDPGTKSLNGRVTVVWKPTNDLTTTLKVNAGQYKDNGPNSSIQSFCPGSTSKPLFFTIFGSLTDPTGDCKVDRYRSAGAFPKELTTGWPDARDGQPYTDLHTALATLSINYELDNLTLTSNSGYLYLNLKSFDTEEGSSFGFNPASIVERDNTFTQELRLNSHFAGPVNFTAGGYFEAAKFRTGVGVNLGIPGADPRTGSYSDADRVTHNNNRAISFFGQLRWNLLENLELAGGARWTREVKRAELVNTFVNQNVVFLGLFMPEGVALSSRVANQDVSPEATLTWHPSPDTTLYAAYKTGYKSGGISNPSLLTADFTEENLKFKPEKAKGGEIGFKGRMLDRRMQVQLTGYYYEYTNLQVSSFNAPTNTFQIRNAGSVIVQGVEGNLDWSPVSGLMLQTSVGYNDAHYKEFPNAPCGTQVDFGCSATVQTRDLAGYALARAPRWSGLVSASYDFEVGRNLKIGLNSGVTFSSSYYTQENDDPAARQGRYALINAGARVYSKDDRWELALIGRNLGNKYLIGYSFDKVGGTAGEFDAATIRAREVSLQGTVRF